ncbi:hypothetical protein [Pseudoalteromonas nigrifaciens]|uniref:hypothetical protein n=1 Tax=Pseudoalteromonas nigrifaciens TaxID=28109 RepID=UPI003FD50AC9
MKYIITPATANCNNATHSTTLFLPITKPLITTINELRIMADALSQCEVINPLNGCRWSSIDVAKLGSFKQGPSKLNDEAISSLQSTLMVNEINVQTQTIACDPVTNSISICAVLRDDGETTEVTTKPIPLSFFHSSHNVYM